MRFLTTVLEPLSVMAIFSPLIGVISIVTIAHANRYLSRALALSNAFVTLTLLCLAVWHYEPQRMDRQGRPEAAQMQTRLDWLLETDSISTNLKSTAHRGFEVQLSFAMDGISIWPAIWIALTIWTVAWFSKIREDTSDSTAFYAGLLLCESSLLASLFARDAIVSILAFELSLPPMYFLIGWHGGREVRLAARSFLMHQLVGCGLTLLGTTILLVSWTWMRSDLVSKRDRLIMDSQNIIDGIQSLLVRSEVAVQIWNDVAPWAMLLLLIGFAIRLPLFPFQGWYRSVIEEVSADIASLATITLPLAAVCCWLRFGMPLLLDQRSTLAWVFTALTVLSVVYSGLLALSEHEPNKFLALSSTGMIGLAALGLRWPTRDGLAGAWLFLQCQCLATVALLLLIWASMQRSRDSFVEISQTGSLKTTAVLAIIVAGPGLAMYGGGIGSLLAYSAMRSDDSWSVIIWIIGNLLMAGSVFGMIHRVWFQRLPSRSVAAQKSHLTTLKFDDLWGLMPIAAALLFAPTLMLKTSQATFGSLLDRVERSAISRGSTEPQPESGNQK